MFNSAINCQLLFSHQYDDKVVFPSSATFPNYFYSSVSSILDYSQMKWAKYVTSWRRKKLKKHSTAMYKVQWFNNHFSDTVLLPVLPLKTSNALKQYCEAGQGCRLKRVRIKWLNQYEVTGKSGKEKGTVLNMQCHFYQ